MAKKILIVDDDLGTLTLLTKLIEARGYECVTSDDGDSAVKKFKAHKPDLILLDVWMPVKDGYQVCNEIRLEENDMKTPIILLTAKEQEIDDALGKKLNIEYVHKSTDMSIILDKIDGYLK